MNKSERTHLNDGYLLYTLVPKGLFHLPYFVSGTVSCMILGIVNRQVLNIIVSRPVFQDGRTGVSVVRVCLRDSGRC